MKIGIIGAGDIGKLYGSLFSQAGHEVILSSRNPGQIPPGDYRIEDVAVAAELGDILLLAVNYQSIDQALKTIAPFVDDKLVIDATNPLAYDADGKLMRLIGEHEVAGMVMQGKLPKAHIAKAFTSLWTGHVEAHSDVGNPRIAMAYAVSRDQDRALVEQLIGDAGLVPFEVGDLEHSGPLDPGSPLWNVVMTPSQMKHALKP